MRRTAPGSHEAARKEAAHGPLCRDSVRRCGDGPATNAEGARRLGERLAHALCERGPVERALGLSYGIAVPGADGDTRDELMSAADQALYAAKTANAKAAGRGHAQRGAAVPATPA